MKWFKKTLGAVLLASPFVLLAITVTHIREGHVVWPQVFRMLGLITVMVLVVEVGVWLVTD